MTTLIFHSLLREYVLFLQHGEPQLKEAYCKVGLQQNSSLFDPEIIFSYSSYISDLFYTDEIKPNRPEITKLYNVFTLTVTVTKVGCSWLVSFLPKNRADKSNVPFNWSR